MTSVSKASFSEVATLVSNKYLHIQRSYYYAFLHERELENLNVLVDLDYFPLLEMFAEKHQALDIINEQGDLFQRVNRLLHSPKELNLNHH